MKIKQQGFALLEGLLIIIVVAVIGFSGWWIYQRDHRRTQSTSSSTTSSSTTSYKEIKLYKNKAELLVPTSWTYTSSSCPTSSPSMGMNKYCLAQYSIKPGVNLPTIYGNGTEYFRISLYIYDNPAGHSLKDFFENDLGNGVGTGDVQTSSAKINGYNGFYLQEQYVSNSSTISDVNYEVSQGDLILAVSARTYEPGTLDNGQTVGDFRQFEPAISSMAHSVKFL